MALEKTYCQSQKIPLHKKTAKSHLDLIDLVTNQSHIIFFCIWVILL